MEYSIWAPKQEFWQCQACFEDQHGDPVVLADNNVCEECFIGGFKPQFEQALNDQTKFPVKWASTPLSIDNYSRFFSADFLARWTVRMKEYAVPIKQRMYCDQQILLIADQEFPIATEEIAAPSSEASLITPTTIRSSVRIATPSWISVNSGRIHHWAFLRVKRLVKTTNFVPTRHAVPSCTSKMAATRSPALCAIW
jgi:hypothetical protein